MLWVAKVFGWWPFSNGPSKGSRVAGDAGKKDAWSHAWTDFMNQQTEEPHVSSRWQFSWWSFFVYLHLLNVVVFFVICISQLANTLRLIFDDRCVKV